MSMPESFTIENRITHNNWIVRDHRVHGVRIVPGVTFLDIIHRLVKEELALDHITLKNVLFHQPLATSERFDRVFFTRFTPAANNAWQVDISSQKIKGETVVSPTREKHLSCILVPVLSDDVAEPPFAIQAFIDNADAQWDMDDVYGLARSVDISHRAFMKTQGRIYQKGNEELMALHLGDLAESVREKFIAHPAFLDGSTLSGASFLLSGKNTGLFEDGTPYIPFTIKRFYLTKNLPATIYVYTCERSTHPEGQQGSVDLLERDITLYNQQGERLAHFAGLTLKRIRQPAFIERLVDESKAIHPAAPVSEASPASTVDVAKPATRTPTAELAVQVSSGLTTPRSLLSVIEGYLKDCIATILKKTVSELDSEVGFYDLGLDSTQLLELTHQLEQFCRREFYPTLLFEYQTIKALADYLAENDPHSFEPLRSSTTADTSANPTVPPGPEKSKRQQTVSVRPDQPEAGDSVQEPIAIIGLAGRYPEADDLAAFWQVVEEGKNCIREIPADRWNIDDWYADRQAFNPDAPHTISRWGGFIPDADKFDPLFFAISPREAEVLDPQLRLLLQTAWHTLEDAGYQPRKLKQQRLGVYVGVMNDDYTWVTAEYLAHTGKYEGVGSYANELANRISYYLDASGPSLAVETACSSSLTAIHLARQALLTGECDVALAGGVNVNAHRSKYFMLSQMGIVSPDPVERTFDEQANGYIPGEGVGLVMMKHLSQAQADGDHIYGVIKGSAINHSGQGAGRYIPNLHALSAVSQSALAQAGLPASAIDYIETHGTGTKLGDPIEVQALTKLFGTQHPSGQCALGSKANIGHLESASGICSLTKVLLAMQQHKIPVCANVEQENAALRLSHTPFYIPKTSQAWNKPTSEKVAGVHAFGVGGSNSFMVIQGVDTQETVWQSEPVLFVLSAKTQPALQRYIQQFVDYLQQAPAAIHLGNLAYTLQVGREEMPWRLAFVTRNKEALVNQLMQHLDAKNQQAKQVGDGYYGEVEKQEPYRDLLQDDIGQAFVQTLIEHKQLDKLAALWIKGVPIDWARLYSEPMRRMSLPVYPFARQRCWLGDHSPFLPTETHSHRLLHPLVHSNVSTFDEQCFQSCFSGNEFFFQDHRVQGTKVLPGVAYLEMARVAAIQAGLPDIHSLRDIIWSQPLTVANTDLRVRITLTPEPQGAAFVVTSGDGEVHCQGRVISGSGRADSAESSPTTMAKVNIEAIKNRCQQFQSPAAIYEAFRRSGLDYGPGFQGIQSLHFSETEAIAKVALAEHGEHFGLHPGLLDAALQASIGLLANGLDNKLNNSTSGLYIPFALKQVALFDHLPSTLYSHVTYSLNTSSSATDHSGRALTDGIVKLTIQLLDEQGQVCLRLTELIGKQTILKPVAQQVARDVTSHKLIDNNQNNSEVAKREVADSDVLYAVTSWQDSSLATDQQQNSSYSPTFQHIPLSVSDSIGPSDITTLFKTQLQCIQTLLRNQVTDRQLLLFTVAEDIPEYAYAPLVALLKTARLENPKIQGRVMTISALAQPKLQQILVQEARAIQAQPDEAVQVRYLEEGRRQVKALGEVAPQAASHPENLPIRAGGVYLITGGAGGLGRLFTDWFHQVEDTQVILMGRAKTPKASLQGEYCCCDMGDAAEVKATLAAIVEKYGRIDGILHSAGVIRDSVIFNKTTEEVDAVMAPKVQGAWYLHQSLQALNLKPDFVVFFSSITGVIGNPGQADYAGANAFLDAFAHYHHYHAIQWPLWAEGGMRIDQSAETRLFQQTGMKPLVTQAGTHALSQLLLGTANSLLVCQGNSTKIRQTFQWQPAANEQPLSELLSEEALPASEESRVVSQQQAQSEQLLTQHQVEQQLIAVCVELLKVKPDDLDVDIEFSDYGVDSILMMRMLDKLEQTYGTTLSPNSIALYGTISALAGYLIEEGIATTTEPVNVAHPSDLPTKSSPSERQQTPPQWHQQATTRRREHLGKSATKSGHKIAIIGTACRLPKSSSLEQFWHNLAMGNDLIASHTERWNSDSILSNNKDDPEKTYTTHAGYLDDVAGFDAEFFKITADEAITLDPQQRIMLELTQELFERAGFTPQALSGSCTGVFIGAKDNHYARNGYQFVPDSARQHIVVSNISNMIAARVADFYNLKGQASAIDTACSSSLVAVHEACQRIQSGEIEMAVAGGIYIMVDSFAHVAFSRAKVLAEDGKSYVFDQRAKGFVLGEGAGLVLLKDYDQALSDGDQILGTILGSAVNNDGRTMGLTVPSQQGQKDVIQAALDKSQVSPESITYLEAHGTGTLLGDPIEIKAVTEVYRQYTQEIGYCATGSVKSNLGHTMTAAGITGLIKIILSMQHRQIPATLHCEQPHPRFGFEVSPFYPNLALTPWEGKNGVRRAAISSFGFGGTNCHMILEEAPSHQTVTRQPLPLTPFQRKHYWLGDRVETTSVQSVAIPDTAVKKEAPLAQTSASDSGELVEAIQVLLQAALAPLLNVEKHQVPLDKNFMEMGLESNAMIETVKDLEQNFGIALFPTLFFEYENIPALSAYFSEVHQAPFLAYLAREKAHSGQQRVKYVEPTAPPQALEKPEANQQAMPLASVVEPTTSDIAIIALSGRYPQANNIEEYWHNLREGKDCITEIPKERWDHSQYFDKDKNKADTSYSKWGGFIDGVDQFDPLFFNISPSEAKLLNPNERLFLETTWNLLETAGYTKSMLQERHQGHIGVFVGAMYQQYGNTGSFYATIANRVSHFFGFQGPSIAIDTMCSSSTIAIHMACESLIKGECQLAIAGGVNLSLTPEKYITLSRFHMVGSGPDSRSFGDGDGYLPCEAVGAVLLKPLAAAIENQDTVLAVIKSSATNHGGYTQGLTVPSPGAQAQLIEDNFTKSGIDPRTISYVESAANGSSLGDPIELSALNKAFRQFTADQHFCAIGSVKSNIGHAEAASGISQLTKVVLQLQHQQLVPSIKATPLNPSVSFDNSPFYLQQETREWQQPVLAIDGEKHTLPRRATISSFGATGSNAHLIIEEYLAAEPAREKLTHREVTQQIIVLSAKNHERLQEMVKNLYNHLQAQLSNDQLPGFVTDSASLGDLAYTLQVGREAMSYRLAIVVSTQQELSQALQDCLQAGLSLSSDFPPANFLFPTFIGSAEATPANVKALFAGKTADLMLQSLLAENNLEKLALFWVQGGQLPWESLHQGSAVRRVALPTYPFERQRYWVEAGGSSTSDITSIPEVTPIQPLLTGFIPSDQKLLQDHLTGIVSAVMQIPIEQINPNTPLPALGFDSMLAVQMSYSLQETLDITITHRELLEHTSIAAITQLLLAKRAERETQNAGAVEDHDQVTPFNSEANEAIVTQSHGLSEGQKGLWLLQQLNPEMSAYNIPIALTIHDKLCIESLKKACQWVLKQHPILQASFMADADGQPYQVIHPEKPLFFKQTSLEQTSAADLTDEEILSRVKARFKQPFDLNGDALMRVDLFIIAPAKAILLITVHHIVIDGTAVLTLIEDILSAYALFRQGQKPALSAHDKPLYFDFIDEEQKWLAGAAGKANLAYWQQQLTGELPVLKLPLDKPRAARQTYTGATYLVELPALLTGQLRQLAKAKQTSLFVVLLAVYKTLLHRYTAQTDVIVGIPTAGRYERRFEKAVGYFVNLLPIRSHLDGSHSFSEYLETLKFIVADAMDHARYPFPALVSNLNMQRPDNHAPVFQTTFVLQSFLSLQAQDTLTEAYPNISLYSELHQEGEDDLGLEVIEHRKTLSLQLSYNPDLFEAETIERLAAHYQQLALAVCENSHQLLAHYEWLTSAERNKLLVEWNNTKRDYPRDQCIHSLVEVQVGKTPEAIAVVFGSQQFTYKALDSKANQLASYLQQQGVKPDSLVGICMERSLEMVIAILGILKAGGAYLPIDPEYPSQRIRYMLEDSQVALLLVQDQFSQRIKDLGSQQTSVLALDTQWPLIQAQHSKIQQNVCPEHLAYVIYTSGSTGNPKGVMVEHRAICNRLVWMQNQYGLTAEDRVLQKTPYSFDVSVWEFLWPLMTGARLVVAQPQEHKNPQYLANIIKQESITTLHFVPSMLRVFLEEATLSTEDMALKRIFCSGEALARDIMEDCLEWMGCELHNLYGPTEAAVDVTYWACQTAYSNGVSIGRPISNTQIYLLDGQLKPCPIGVPGQLFIAGEGLARGYLNLPSLTQEKFIENPFNGTSRMYATGDLARWLPDGNIEYLGRIDDQVKIRGFRVECAEIEAVINQQAGVDAAVVVAKSINGSTQLVAYYTLKPSANSSQAVPDEAALRRATKARLAAYMVPAVFIRLDTLPLSANGKANRKVLKQREVTLASKRRYLPPSTETARQLAQLWCDMLALEKVGMADDFFELGGHSLLAVRMIARINQQFGLALPLSVMLECKTLAEMTRLITRSLESPSAEKQQPYQYLVPIQPAGQQAPLYLVHGAGGNSFAFIPLSQRLGNEQPLFAFQPPGSYGEQPPLKTVEALASFYVDQLLAHSDQAQFMLGGWSMGGVIAYEMACQLQAKGKSVKRLVLIDSYLQAHIELLTQQATSDAISASLLDAQERLSDLSVFTHLVKELNPNITDEALRTFASRHQGKNQQALIAALGEDALLNAWVGDVGLDRIQQLLDINLANLNALKHYQAKQMFSGEAWVFQAAGEKYFPAIEQTHRAVWNKYLEPSQSRFIPIQGSHYTMIQEPAVKAMAVIFEKEVCSHAL